MKALRVTVKTRVNILVEDDDDYWTIKHNAMQQVHDDIHWNLEYKFLIDYENIESYRKNKSQYSC